jgi:beta-galactosidase
VPYEPGTLEAVANKKGKRIVTKIETTDTAYKIIAKADKITLAADGKDATVINIVVVDSKGREVPDANHLIQFNINGDAQIIGVGNGDPSSHENDKFLNGTQWQRKLFNGKCQVIIQSGKNVGSGQFNAISNGLQSSTININIQ